MISKLNIAGASYMVTLMGCPDVLVQLLFVLDLIAPMVNPFWDAKKVAPIRLADQMIPEYWSRADTQKWQREDLDIGKIIQWMESSEEIPS